jgi:ribonuclease H2 subunit A
LTEAKRRTLAAKARAHPDVGFVVLPITAPFISTSMLRRVPYSLNAMSHDAAMEMVREVQRRGVTIAHVYVDTVGEPGSYERKLTAAFRNRVKFTVSKKADSLFPVVSAASILAKVARDAVLPRWVFTEPFLAARFPPPGTDAAVSVLDEADEGDAAGGGGGRDAVVVGDDSDVEEGDDGGGGAAAAPAAKRRRSGGDSDGEGADTAVEAGRKSKPAFPPFAKRLPGWRLHPSHAGSGYPGDAITKRWLRDTVEPLFGWPDVMRFSWGTAKELLKEVAVDVDWGDEDEGTGIGGSGGPGNKRLTSFFGGGSGGASGAGGVCGGMGEPMRATWARARGIAAVGCGAAGSGGIL